jgi:predicted DNA-binding transcriptional regulator AlpA
MSSLKRLIPDPQVCQRYNVSPMTIWRWDHDPALDFPKPIYIRNRKYRDERELDAFDEARRAADFVSGD